MSYKKLAYIIVLLGLSITLKAQTNKGCNDSSFHIRYKNLVGYFNTIKQITTRKKEQIIVCKSTNSQFDSSVIIYKTDSLKKIIWSKKIAPQSPFIQLNLYAIEEAGNGNIGVTGLLTDNNTDGHFYRIILSASGNTIRQDITSSPIVTSTNKGIQTVCQLSTDSLIYMYYIKDYTINGFAYNGLLIQTTDNSGNIGSSKLLALLTSPDDAIHFSHAKVVGNKLRLWGNGYSSICNNGFLNGTFVSMQYDRNLSTVDYLKTYCVPNSNSGNAAYSPPNDWNSVSYMSSRIFHLNNGKVAMVRPYTGFSFTPTPGMFVPMFIAYFDSSFNLLRSGYLKSDRIFKAPALYDLYISPDETKHFNFADYVTKQVYYAVADSANRFLLQKKMPLPSYYNWGNTYGTQVLENGKFTGFTINSTGNNQTFIDYVQIRGADTSAACFGTDTSFLSFIPLAANGVSSSPVTVLPTTNTSTPVNFIVEDYPLIREDFCIIKTICDTIKLHAPDTVCNISQPVIITAHKNPLCSGKINFTFDTAQVQSHTQINDTTLSIRFNKNCRIKIFARPSTCDKLADSAEIIISIPLTAINLGNDTVYCPGKTYLLNAHNPGFKTYQWQDGSTDSIYLASSPGVYSVAAIDFCNRLYTDTIRVVKKEFKIDLGKDSTICKSESMTLSVAAGYFSYNWFPQYALTPDAPNRVTIRPEISTTYSVEAEVLQGCKLSDTVNISVENCPQYIYFPTGFTPNNDGLNDYFKPSIGGALIKYELQIYNRWGQLVFQTATKTVGWDGKLKGLLQSSGTFVWQCKYQFYGKPEKMIKGSFMLIR